MLKRTFFALTIAMMLVMGLAGCATQEKSNDSGNIVDVVNEAVNAQATNVVRIQDEAAEAIAELREVSYPSAWVIGVNWALDGTRVQVLSLPDRQVEYRIDGVAIAEDYISEPTYNKLDFIGPKTVPEGCVFVMGDNRNASIDSRKTEIGMLDNRLILGRAYCVVYPVSQFRIID